MEVSTGEVPAAGALLVHNSLVGHSWCRPEYSSIFTPNVQIIARIMHLGAASIEQVSPFRSIYGYFQECHEYSEFQVRLIVGFHIGFTIIYTLYPAAAH